MLDQFDYDTSYRLFIEEHDSDDFWHEQDMLIAHIEEQLLLSDSAS